MILDPSGSVSGAPTQIGTFTVTIQAQDANWPGNQAQAVVWRWPFPHRP